MRQLLKIAIMIDAKIIDAKISVLHEVFIYCFQTHIPAADNTPPTSIGMYQEDCSSSKVLEALALPWWWQFAGVMGLGENPIVVTNQVVAKKMILGFKHLR